MRRRCVRGAWSWRGTGNPRGTHMTGQRTTVGMALLIASMWTLSVGAGTLFRLEVGPPVAAGDGAGKLKGAVLVARAVVCDDLTKAVVTAAAEGLIGGRRQSI